MLRTGSITPSFLKKLYDETKNVKPTFTPEERELYNYYNTSKAINYYHLQDGYNRFDELGRIFFDHCVRPCCLGENAGMCVLHRTYATYCLFRHLMEKTDFQNCPTCKVISYEDKCRFRDHFNHPSFQKDSSYNYVIHIHNCNGCWKCKQLHKQYMSAAAYRLPSVYSPSETSSNPNNDFLPVPKGIFYTQESDEPNHSGYLRIIPLAYENTVTSCDDYRDLVRAMNGDKKYKEEKEFSYKRIDNEEREYRSVLSLRQPVFERYQQKYDVEIKQECVEELAISLKKYLIHILCCCQEERQLCGKDKDSDEFVIDEDLVLRVLKRHQYCVSRFFSLYHSCVC